MASDAEEWAGDHPSLYALHGWLVERMFDDSRWRACDRRRLARCRKALDRHTAHLYAPGLAWMEEITEEAVRLARKIDRILTKTQIAEAAAALVAQDAPDA